MLIKNNVPTGIALAVFLFIFVPVTSVKVGAHGDTAGQVAHAEEAAPSPEEKAAQKQRIDKLKASLKTKLSNAEKQRIQAKCKGSQQGPLHAFGDKLKGLETSREQVYGNTLTRLNKLKDRLKTGGADVTALEAQIVTLEALTATFKTDLAAHKQAITDLNGMDCASDPDGFKAALDTARTTGNKLREDVKAVRTHINDVIKPTLKTIRASLSTGDSEGTQ